LFAIIKREDRIPEACVNEDVLLEFSSILLRIQRNKQYYIIKKTPLFLQPRITWPIPRGKRPIRTATSAIKAHQNCSNSAVPSLSTKSASYSMKRHVSSHCHGNLEAGILIATFNTAVLNKLEYLGAEPPALRVDT
jgi:hypothetical protein